jgi:hypothetical protein
MSVAASAPPVNRSCNLLCVDGNPFLVIADNAGTKYYALSRVPGASDAWRLLRLDSKKVEWHEYFVSLHGEHPSCDCPSHAYRGHERPCRHVAALLSLRACGRLS